MAIKVHTTSLLREKVIQGSLTLYSGVIHHSYLAQDKPFSYSSLHLSLASLCCQSRNDSIIPEFLD